MRLLLDVNIWIDIGARPKSFPDSVKLYSQLEKGGHQLCLAGSSYTTVCYLMGRIVGPQGALHFLYTLLQRGTRVIPFTSAEISVSHKLNFSDHEDACLAASALNGGCDLIVSRNLKDFKNSPVAAKSPEQILKLL